MKLQDILNANLSPEAKLELISFFQNGGIPEEIKEKEKPQAKGTIRPTETITIGDDDYDVAIADSDELRRQGLEPYEYLNEDEGMLFIFEEEVNSPFTMANCGIDLDIIFIDSEGVVIEVKEGKAYSDKPIKCSEPYQFVLEVNAGSDISAGDELEQESDSFNEEDKQTMSKNKMLVLDSEGNVQMRLHGGERIFSRIFTRKMLKAAIKAYKTDDKADYRRVGKLVLNELDAQDNREPEYTQLES